MNASSTTIRPADATFSTSRWATWATWIAILAPLPYSLSRVLWATGIPVGFSDEGLHEIGIPGSGTLTVLVLVLLAEATAVFVHAFLLSPAPKVPGWIPLLRGRPVRPRIVIAVLLLPIAILVYANAISVLTTTGLVEFPDTGSHQDGWAGAPLTGVVCIVWLPALTAATLAYHRRTR